MTIISGPTTRLLKRIALLCAICFLTIQTIRPARTNPSTDSSETLAATLHPPSDVSTLLQRGCSDCHTNNTAWPWYTNVAPVSWWTVHHVNEGRASVSFSDWGGYDRSAQDRKLSAACTRLEKHDMPLPSYLLMHPEARLTDAERARICDWTKTITNQASRAGSPSSPKRPEGD